MLQRLKILSCCLLTAGFFVFCAAVYFGCCISFSLLSQRQTVLMAILWLLAVRAVTVPFWAAFRRAGQDPDTTALYYFDGLKRYLSVIGWDIWHQVLFWLTMLPGLGCLWFWYRAMTMETVFAAGIFFLCGMILLMTAVLGYAAGRWYPKKSAPL